ncbi:hypothetical protein F5Y15DRAFT_425933 [Xylariaceae sp. FL0016]|nr:hypothetical protein F5Y15DRAFT_425933 [Xylariaceae sp. FL0016]
MSTGGTSGHLLHTLDRSAGENPDSKLTAAMKGDTKSSSTGSSVLENIKEALKPGDLKRSDSQGSSGGSADDASEGESRRVAGVPGIITSGNQQAYRDATESSGDGGLLDKLMPGNQDHSTIGGIFDKLRSGRDSGGALETKGGDSEHTHGLDSMNPGDSSPKAPGGFEPSVTRHVAGATQSKETEMGTKRPGTTERTQGNYQYDRFPEAAEYHGPSDRGEVRSLGELGYVDDRSVPRTSAFDAKGSIGQHFTSEGAIGKTADKAGGPFSKEGTIGKHFTDTGAVGGRVQDHLGHGDATRQGK